MSKSNEKIILLNEGQMKLVDYLVSSCATFLEVEVSKKKEKNSAELTVDLIKGIESKLREDYLNAMMGEDELSKLKAEHQKEVERYQKKVKELEERLNQRTKLSKEEQ